MSRFNTKPNLFGEPTAPLSTKISPSLISPNVQIISPPSSTKNGPSFLNSSNVTSLPSITPNTSTQRHSRADLSLNFANSSSIPSIKQNKFSSSFINSNKFNNKLDETKILFENENNQIKSQNSKLTPLSSISSGSYDQVIKAPTRIFRTELKTLNLTERDSLKNLETPNNKVSFELGDSKKFSTPFLNLTPSRSSSASSVSLSSSTNSLSRLEAVDSDKFRKIMVNSGYLLIDNERIKVSMDELLSIELLGCGTSGVVTKMKHKPTGYQMAVKQMCITGIEEENKRILTDVDVIAKSNNCKNIVKCLGYTISQSDVWIFMELMLLSFDELLKLNDGPIPEKIIGKLSVSILNALNYLKEKHNMMHRDVKPSNILIDENGEIKLCDFGISGRLVNSKAFSKNTNGNFGSTGYAAPERIDSKEYDVRADVWSFGITVVELANGEYPYKNCKTEFETLSAIISQDPPELKGDHFSDMFKSFIQSCLQKKVELRPKYNELLDHEFVRYYKNAQVDVKSWLFELLKKKEQLVQK